MISAMEIGLGLSALLLGLAFVVLQPQPKRIAVRIRDAQRRRDPRA